VLLGQLGCEAAAIAVATVGGPERVPPQFVLEDRPTLVMVDDPQHRLDNPSLARQIGTTAVYYLQTQEVLEDAPLIDPRQLGRLEVLLDRDWPTTPIDEIGRRLGAEQVIHAKVVSVTYRDGDGVYRPEGVMEVKVIDATNGRRLWPEAPPLLEPGQTVPGQRVSARLDPDAGLSASDARDNRGDAGRRLADELGQVLARQFYEWRREEPGASL
jgi:hypothetical protein